jgi:hypothetical protein
LCQCTRVRVHRDRLLAGGGGSGACHCRRHAHLRTACAVQK